MALRRLSKELKDIQSDLPTNVSSVELVGGDLYHWRATIVGSHNTPYKDGKFIIDIRNPKNYPFKPPKIKFHTKIYHCNINDKGGICLYILHDEWSPALTISKVLLTLSSIIEAPNPDDALRPDIAQLYYTNKALHDKRANDMAVKHADATYIKYYTADVPVIHVFDCEYYSQTQQIKCVLKLKHPHYHEYQDHINSMYIELNIKDNVNVFTKNVYLGVTVYEFIIDKEIQYGSGLSLTAQIKFDSTKWDKFSDIESRHQCKTLNVATLDKEQYLRLIEGYMKREMIDAIAMDIIELCFAYYWKYVVIIKCDDLLGSMNDHKSILLTWNDIRRNMYSCRIKGDICRMFGCKDYKYIGRQMKIEQHEYDVFPKIINVSVDIADEVELIVTYTNCIKTFKLCKYRNEYNVYAIRAMIKAYWNIDETLDIYLIMNDELSRGKTIENDLDVYEYIVVDKSSWNTSVPSCIVKTTTTGAIRRIFVGNLSHSSSSH